MEPSTSIRYVSHSAINKFRWDKCIDESPNGLVYAYSWYLDNMAKNWDALILNDYEAVMPLTWNKKWGFRYLYQPPITPQLGIFSASPISESLIGMFLEQVRRHFRFAEIFLNFNNRYPALRRHTNYVLSLHEDYSILQSRYKKSLKKNINRSARFNLEYNYDFDLKEALDLYKKTYAIRTPHVRNSDFQRFENMCMYAQSNKNALVRAALSKQGKLLAVAMLLKKKNRMYLLESTTLKDGRKLEANHFLMDNIIREFAGTHLTFDFDGSDIPGIAYYYQTFGAEDQPYFFYRHNDLPWWVKWMKK